MKCDQMYFFVTRYLPKNVTRFNAYAIHGTKWGEASPSEEDKRYEALYPVDPKVVPNPDFHALDFFQTIDLSEIGFEGVNEPSELLRHALGTDNRPFEGVYTAVHRDLL